jgi:hypothetical protein
MIGSRDLWRRGSALPMPLAPLRVPGRARLYCRLSAFGTGPVVAKGVQPWPSAPSRRTDTGGTLPLWERAVGLTGGCSLYMPAEGVRNRATSRRGTAHPCPPEWFRGRAVGARLSVRKEMKREMKTGRIRFLRLYLPGAGQAYPAKWTCAKTLRTVNGHIRCLTPSDLETFCAAAVDGSCFTRTAWPVSGSYSSLFPPTLIPRRSAT